MYEEYLIDDRPVDISKFEGLAKEDIDKAIWYIEYQETKRKARSGSQTKEEQLADLAASEKDYEKLLEYLKNKKLLKTG